MQFTVEDAIGARPSPTSFVGRRGELAELRSMVGLRRLVTIAGPGGAGKTRLAEELAASVSRSIGESIAFAYLDAVADPDEVWAAVAAALGIRGGGDPVELGVAYLPWRPT